MPTIHPSTCTPTAPPPCSTGVPTPLPRQAPAVPSALVDWLQVTFPVGSDPRHLVPSWGDLEWVELAHGRYGYRQAIQCGGIRVDFDGTETMGPHMTLDGTGCREIEALGLVPVELTASCQGLSWPALLRELISLGGKATRIDTALDDRSRMLSVDQMREQWEEGNTTSVWKQMISTREVGKKGRVAGNGFRLGAPTSDAMLRVYDKALEQEMPAGTHWVRVELQLRRKRADRLMHLIAEREPAAFGPLIAGLIHGYVSFREGVETRTWRRATCKWWLVFLGQVEGCRLGSDPRIRTVASVRAWIENQCAPSIALVLADSGGDLGWLREVAMRGRDRMSARHLAMLRLAA